MNAHHLELGERVDVDALFRAIDNEFLFTLDACATPETARCAHFYGEDDSLLQSWRGERVWLIPPLSNIDPWVAKAWSAAVLTNALVVALVPAWTDQPWWQKNIEPNRDDRNAEVIIDTRFLPIRAGPSPLVVVIFRPRGRR